MTGKALENVGILYDPGVTQQSIAAKQFRVIWRVATGGTLETITVPLPRRMPPRLFSTSDKQLGFRIFHCLLGPRLRSGMRRAYSLRVGEQTKKGTMKRLLTIAVVGVALAFQAHAVSIVGGISMTGQAALDTGDANTANAVVAWLNASVPTFGASGDFAAAGIGTVVATPVTLSPWTFAPPPGIPAAPLWTVTSVLNPGATFAFNLGTSVVDVQTGGNLAITGLGTITSTVPGLDPTPFEWNFTTQNPPVGDNPPWFTFSASALNTARVPDGGLTLGLLGLALMGVEGLRRRFAA